MMNEEDDAGLVRRIHGSRSPLVVDVWATWCGPCKALSPILDALSEEHTELEFIKVDADANPALLDRYSIRGIPTVLVFADGELIGQRTGAGSKAVMEGWLAEILR